jgi:hypothetical protein
VRLKNTLIWMWVAAAIVAVVILVIVSNPKIVFGREIEGASHEVPALKPAVGLQLTLLSSRC